MEYWQSISALGVGLKRSFPYALCLAPILDIHYSIIPSFQYSGLHRLRVTNRRVNYIQRKKSFCESV